MDGNHRHEWSLQVSHAEISLRTPYRSRQNRYETGELTSSLVRREESAKIVSYGQVFDMTFAWSIPKGCYVAGIKPHATSHTCSPTAQERTLSHAISQLRGDFTDGSPNQTFGARNCDKSLSRSDSNRSIQPNFKIRPQARRHSYIEPRSLKKVGLLLVISLSPTYRSIPSKSFLVLLPLSLVVNFEHWRL